MSFSAEWLGLREPVDHASRSPSLNAEVAAHFAARPSLRILDLGCGTGSNLRASYRLLPARQTWLLADHDAALLTAAAARLRDWADDAVARDDALILTKDAKTLEVRFTQADLTRDLSALLADAPDLVTASALFDLISAPWIADFARRLAACGAAFHTVLTYDGRDDFFPAHALDRRVIHAFAQHQTGDKGFGPAAGPQGADVLARAFRAAGFRVREADSPWRIGPHDAALAAPLLAGIAGAARETGALPTDEIDAWLAFRLAALDHPGAEIITGHRDTFAVPA